MKNGNLTAAIWFVVLAVIAAVVWQLSYSKATTLLWQKDVDQWLMIANISKYGAMACGGGAVIFTLLGLQGGKKE